MHGLQLIEQLHHMLPLRLCLPRIHPIASANLQHALPALGLHRPMRAGAYIRVRQHLRQDPIPQAQPRKPIPLQVHPFQQRGIHLRAADDNL